MPMLKRASGNYLRSKTAADINALLASRKPLNEIPGGKAAGKAPADFNKSQLRRGIKVEKEHTPSKKKALEIAQDHISEFPSYYKGLARMEKQLDKKAVFLRPAINAGYTVANKLVGGRLGPRFSHPLVRNISANAGYLDEGLKSMARDANPVPAIRDLAGRVKTTASGAFGKIKSGVKNVIG